MLERCGTGTRIGGKDAGEMEGAAQGRQMYSDGGLYWEARGTGDKIAEDYGRYGGIKFGSVSVYSVPASLQRCGLGREWALASKSWCPVVSSFVGCLLWVI